MPETLFEETLQFRQPQLWIPYLILFIVVMGSLTYFLFRSPSPGNLVIRLFIPAICLLVLGGVATFLYISRLEVKVMPSGLQTRFFPLERSFRNLEWKDINQMQITTLRPMRDFGGWGLRLGRNSKAYIVTGSQSIGLELADGSRLYINTLEPERFLSALTRGKEAALQELR